MHSFWQDLRYGLHMLAKNPGFTAIAVLTLALGVGANTALFSVVDAVLLRSLPYHNSQRLIDIFSTNPTGDRDGISIPEFEDLRNQMRSLEDIAAFQSQSVNLTGGERTEGGDAPLMAQILTLQTIGAVFTMPAFIALAG